ncbi:uncharacterized protein MYCFIDRAFT_176567 [Pseudocercospora fijiensis CIRAD86]|uniref:Uncharacterized protein n=1 Tax=Pseudocercospora fijiensis (strain CIRAD86) TaxID=383855 RepID=M3AVY5_PSEFD|nr:uncharacterized protein MYCFIDRAFT_176567 [Pseudocercospora fijiensis CIRAD86]EME81268.1 hypothetical protein MYCFIDRAFT_176567 [Pseudocercospora fijiensis CIRAD86]
MSMSKNEGIEESVYHVQVRHIKSYQDQAVRRYETTSSGSVRGQGQGVGRVRIPSSRH